MSGPARGAAGGLARAGPSERPARGASAASVLLAVVVVGAAGAGLWWVAGGPGDGAGVDGERVVVVEAADVLDAVTASGRVEPQARIAVMSRASGILEKILVEEGDEVVAGQVLAELDREQLAAQLLQDEADVASAQARLAAARARLAAARVDLEDPELDFAREEAERLDELYETGDVSLRERDAAARILATVRFRLDQVAASLPVLEAAVAEAEADLAAGRAALERSATALREATIRSPIDGVVLVRHKEVGDGVSSLLTAGGNATQILTLGDLTEMHVEARVDEVDLGRIRTGMPARVTVDAHRGRELPGRVERIAPAGSVDDNGIVTFEVRIAVEDPDGLLRPDMTAEARLVIAEREDVPTLPQRALVHEDDKRWTVLRVVGEGPAARVQPVEVAPGLSDGLVTEVSSGLAVGDRVLVPDRIPRP